MYSNLGYIVYRTILDYYSGDQEEDAYGKYRFECTLKKTIKINYAQIRLAFM